MALTETSQLDLIKSSSSGDSFWLRRQRMAYGVGAAQRVDGGGARKRATPERLVAAEMTMARGGHPAEFNVPWPAQ